MINYNICFLWSTYVGLVIEKAYGKQLIYSAVQDQETALDKNEIEEYKKKISDTRAEVLDLQKKVR